MKPYSRTTQKGRSGLLAAMVIFCAQASSAQQISTPLVDTMQDQCFDLAGLAIACPAEGEALYGQDAQHPRLAAAYADNGNGTVTDTNTGFVWQKTPEPDRLQFADAIGYCAALELGGLSNWRVPTIKELYSLADFRGELLKPEEGSPTPYLDTTAFDFDYPDAQMIFAGQYWSSTLYVKGPIMNGQNQGAFGFNFADGHIKAYGTGLDFFTGEAAASSGLANGPADGKAPGNYVRCVSGEEGVYGVNDFVDNADGTVTDAATGRMWQQADDGTRREWAEALAYCEALDLGGHQDWYLPNSKELQSIVDYDKTDFPAIDTSRLRHHPGFRNARLLDQHDLRRHQVPRQCHRLRQGAEQGRRSDRVYRLARGRCTAVVDQDADRAGTDRRRSLFDQCLRRGPARQSGALRALEATWHSE